MNYKIIKKNIVRDADDETVKQDEAGTPLVLRGWGRLVTRETWV